MSTSRDVGRGADLRNFRAFSTPGQRVLVTGGSGFIGTNVVEFYRDAGCEVVNADLAPPRNCEHLPFFRRVDIRNMREVDAIIGDVCPTIVHHLAARTDLDGHTVSDYSTNTVGTQHVIRALLSRVPTPRHTIFASSRLVCKIGYAPKDDTDYCPTTAYGRSKVEGEKIVREIGDKLRWTIVRPTSIWGPWFAVPYRDFFESVARGRYMHPRRQRLLKSFGYVENAVWQIHYLASAVSDASHRKTTYLCDYSPVDVYNWAAMIAAAFGSRRPLQIPVSVLRAAASVGDALELLGIRAPLTSFRLSNLLTRMVHDTTLLQSLVPAVPFTVQDGVKRTADWMLDTARRS